MEITGELVVKSEDGTPRIVLSAGKSIACIAAYGDNGAEALLEAGDGRTGVILRRTNGRDAVMITSNDGWVKVILFDVEAKPRVVLSYDPVKSGCTLTRRDARGRSEVQTLFE